MNKANDTLECGLAIATMKATKASSFNDPSVSNGPALDNFAAKQACTEEGEALKVNLPTHPMVSAHYWVGDLIKDTACSAVAERAKKAFLTKHVHFKDQEVTITKLQPFDDMPGAWVE